ncbi:MAG: portal protein [Candidatus Thorarchaeota archaeon]
MLKVVKWDEKQIKTKLSKKLSDAKLYRKRCTESKWKENEITVFEPGGLHNSEDFDIAAFDIDSAIQSVFDTDVNVPDVNYVYRHVKFLHSQLIANPPMVQPRPNSTDVSDKRSAESADALIHYGLRQYKLKNVFELSCLNTMVYGIGWIKSVWDETKGRILDFDDTKGILKVEGDMSFESKSPWDIWTQPHKEAWSEMEYIFERVWYNEDELEFNFTPKQVKLIKKRGDQKHKQQDARSYADKFRSGDDFKEVIYGVYWYWEKGLPMNGYLGRHVACLNDGTPVTDVEVNPHRFIPTEVREEKLNGDIEEADMYSTARLPFHPLQGDKVAGQFYSNTFVSYEKAIQDMINKLDHLTMENIEANGSVNAVVSEASGIDETTINDGGPWQVWRVADMSQAPTFKSAGGQMPDIQMFRDKLKGAGEDMAALNESMFGQQSREQSAMAMEYAVSQGNLVRRNIFEHYVEQVEAVYKDYLDLIRTHWNTSRTIRVMGKEKAFEAFSIKGANIEGGFDIVVEYGTSMFLDPVLRKQELVQNFAMYQQMGVDPKVLLEGMEMGDAESIHDYIKAWERRQSEIFEQMVAHDIYIEPEEMQDHQAMIAYGYKYLSTAEFRDLDDDDKKLIRQHIRAREELAKGTIGGGQTGALQGQAPAGPAAPAEGAAPGMPAPPQGPGMGQ